MTIELEEPIYTTDNIQVLKDLFGGTVGGIAQVLVGQPFDTVKVRLQSAPKGTYSGTLDVVRKLISNEGFSGFFKGTLMPLVGVGACVSVQFSVNEYMKRLYHQNSDKKTLSLHEYFNCGVVAGFSNGFLASPIEHVRIRLQTQSGVKRDYAGPLDCLKKIYKASGLYHGIFRGLSSTLFREAFGLGSYFTTYEYLISKEMHRYQIERKDISSWKLCLFGALSGYSLWLVIYPVDVIKSVIQTSPLTKKSSFGTTFNVAKFLWQTYGLRGFYKGYLATLLRAAPANGATFGAFEVTMRMIN